LLGASLVQKNSFGANFGAIFFYFAPEKNTIFRYFILFWCIWCKNFNDIENYFSIVALRF